MKSYYVYGKSNKKIKKRLTKISGILILISGLIITSYIFFPLLSWQFYFASAFAAQNLHTPIPKPEVLSTSSWGSLISEAGNILSGTDYTNAQTWFPSYTPEKKKTNVAFFNISIPKIKLENAIVSTQDTNLSNHLINYPGTAVPLENGNSVIFGHSTLPQLFDPKNYKTIFAKVYQLEAGDTINVKIDGQERIYKVFEIAVVDADDTSFFTQEFNDSYLTLVTCTPPGTTWKRLIIKSRLDKSLRANAGRKQV